MPAGRPSAYKPEFVRQAAKLCRLGATDVELADFFGVSITTIKRWITEHPQFRASLKSDKEPADSRVERSLFQRANGYTYDAVKIFPPKGDQTEPLIVPYREHVPPDTTACIFWLKNRRRDLWRDQQDHQHTGKDGGPIAIEAMTDEQRGKAVALLVQKIQARQKPEIG